MEMVEASTDSATDQLASLQLAAAATAAAAAAPAAAAKANIRCFTEAAPDATLFFQIIDLGQQVYVWVSVGGAKFQNLYLAIQSRMVSPMCKAHSVQKRFVHCDGAAALTLPGRNSAWLLPRMQDPVPSVATLLPDAASGGAAGMAQRLGEQQGLTTAQMFQY
jgi:hypothetical protein